MVDEKILLACAKTGNADAFGELYELYAKQLYLYALKYLGNKEDAQDAVQQATLNVYKSIANVKNSSSFKAYYFKALANTARTMMKTTYIHIIDANEMKDVAAQDNVENGVIDKFSVDKALESLTKDEREIVLLSAVGGLTSKEIAAVTNLTSGSVRSKLSRTLDKMRRELESEQ